MFGQRLPYNSKHMPFFLIYRVSLITRFGMIVDDLTTVRINLVGVILHILYIVFFYTYTTNAKDKTYVWAQLGVGGAFVVGAFAYAQVEDPKLLAERFGWLVTAVLFALVGSPFLGLVSLRQIIGERKFIGSSISLELRQIYH